MRLFRREFETGVEARSFMEGVAFVNEQELDELTRYIACKEGEPLVLILRDRTYEGRYSAENAAVIGAICADLGLDAADIHDICQPLDINPNTMTAQQAAEYALGAVEGTSDWDDPDWLTERLIHRAEYERVRDEDWADDLAGQIEDLIGEHIHMPAEMREQIGELARWVQRAKLEELTA